MVGDIDIGADHDGFRSRCGANPAGAIGIVDERRLGTGIGHDVRKLALAVCGVGGYHNDARAKRRHVSDDQLE